MKTNCSHCGEKLKLDENWTEASKKHRSYLCVQCASEKGSLWWHQHKRPDQNYGKPQSAAHIAKRATSSARTLRQNPKPCIVCKIPFVRTRPAQTYCSGKCWNKVHRARRKNPPRFSIPAGHYAALLVAQESKCAICGSAHKSNARKEALAVDHCHETGAVRGLLCHRCNTAIGLLKDDVKILDAARAYLARFVIP
jgi:hypothetical protein